MNDYTELFQTVADFLDSWYFSDFQEEWSLSSNERKTTPVEESVAKGILQLADLVEYSPPLFRAWPTKTIGNITQSIKDIESQGYILTICNKNDDEVYTTVL
jgi:hypothetical protein